MKKYKKVKKVKLFFENGETRDTLISSKFENDDIERMGVNQYFHSDLDAKIDNQLCIKVEIE